MLYVYIKLLYHIREIVFQIKTALNINYLAVARTTVVECKREKREADAPSTLSYEIPMIALKKLKGLRPPPPPLKQPHGMHACTRIAINYTCTHAYFVILLFIHFSSEHTNEMQQQQQQHNNGYRF
uniref:Uncharacterized protein n=1 Tax=Glossina palpalis gambiensis TaxID=67801 RepID=A0A1B0BN87_9MUSC